jgi:Uma2 family endonuclease
MTPNRTTDFENMGELLDQLGGISPYRVRLKPAPGTATERDLLEILDHTNIICELIDGVLVEKVLGFMEGCLGAWLIRLMGPFLQQHDLGDLFGADAPMRLMPRLVRLPAVSFVSWKKMPGRKWPREPIPDLVPDLAIEVLSEGNTPREMERKLRDYFFVGVDLVWFVDPDQRTVVLNTAPDAFTTLTEADTLDGGTVLPGFTLPVARIFERLPDVEPPAQKKRRKKTR